jgi:spermidine synthase
VIEFALPHLRYAGAGPGAAEQTAAPLADILLELLRQRPDATHAAAVLGVTIQEEPVFASAYAASELAVQAWLAELASDTQRARQLVRLGYEANPRDRWIASDLADDLFEVARAEGTLSHPGTPERILRIYPAHVGALRAIWERERAGRQGATAAALERLKMAAPLDNPAGAIGVPLP